jgi:hypothetical protein
MRGTRGVLKRGCPHRPIGCSYRVFKIVTGVWPVTAALSHSAGRRPYGAGGSMIWTPHDRSVQSTFSAGS